MSLFTRTQFFRFLALCLASQVSAQSILDEANAALEQEDAASSFNIEEYDQAPQLYDGEVEDIGPQYLLIPGSPAHDWFSVVINTQWFFVSNPMQVEDTPSRTTDLRVLTAQFGAVTPNRSLFGGVVSGDVGVRYQRFEYGQLKGDKVIGGAPISENDFDAATIFSQARWDHGNWSARLGLRWTTLENDRGGRDFYNELVPSWAMGYNYFLGANTRLRAEYDGAYFISKGESAFAVSDNFNDRYSNAVGLSLLHRITSELYIQPNARINYAVYTNDPNGDREDTTYSVGLDLSYYFTRDVVLRLFGNYQKRDSTGLGITNYENFDYGLGGTLSFQF